MNPNSLMQAQLDEAKGIGLNNYFRDRASKLPDAVQKRYPIQQYDFPALNHRKVPNHRMIAGMATMPSRLQNLARVLDRVLIQVDVLHLYLNNFKSIPDFLIDQKIRFHRSQEHGDLRDNGKLFGLQYADRAGDVYFTLDDDIIYPNGYCNYLLESLLKYTSRVAVGIHGIIYPAHPKSFFRRLAFNFTKELRHDIPVSVLGTGTMAFWADMLAFEDVKMSPTGMADLVIAEKLRSSSVSLICLSRPKNWLSEANCSLSEDSIYNETTRDESRHLHFLQSKAPWGIRLIEKQAKQNHISRNLDNSAREFIEFLLSIENNKANEYGSHNEKIANFASAGKLAFINRDHYRKLSNSLARASAKYNIAGADTWHIHVLEIIASSGGIEKSIQNKEDLDRAQTILCNYRNETGDEYVCLVLDIVTGCTLSEKTISRLFLYFSAVELYQVFESLAKKKEVGLWKLLLAQKHLLAEGQSLEHHLYPKKELLVKNARSHELLNAAVSFASKPKIMNLFLRKFANKHLTEDQKERELSEFISLLEKSNREISEGSLGILLANNAIPRQSKIDLCKGSINNAWSSKEKAKQWLASRSEKQDTIQDEIEGLENRLLLAQCQANPKNDTLNAINYRNSMSGLESIMLDKTKESFFDSLGCRAIAATEDHGLCTVVITAFNSNTTLRYSLDSITKQSYKDLEIIVVDDGNNSELESIVSDFNFQHIKIIRNKENLGPYASRNKAIDHAHGKYIAIQDADDWSHPQRISKQINALQESSVAIACFGRHVRFDADGELKLENNQQYLGDGPVTSIFKADAFKNLGMFRNTRTRGDMEFKNRIINAHGPGSILHIEPIVVLSLDWASNSKINTNTNLKKTLLKEFKEEYAQVNEQLLIFKTST